MKQEPSVVRQGIPVLQGGEEVNSTYVGIRDLPKWSAFLGVLSLVLWLGLFTSPRMCTTGGIDEGGGVCADAGDALLVGVPGFGAVADALLITGVALVAVSVMATPIISTWDRRRSDESKVARQR